MGIGLVVTGALLTLFAFFRYRRTARRIEEQNFRQDPRLLTIITAFIFLMGVLLIVYLIGNI
jgi:putative membrane protein